MIKKLLPLLLLFSQIANAGDVFIWGSDTGTGNSCAYNLSDGICFQDGTFQSTAAAGSATSYPPTGAAGGDLSGTYPNPKLLKATSYPNGFLVTGASGELRAVSYPLAAPYVSSSSSGITKLNGDVVTSATGGAQTAYLVKATSYPNGFLRTGSVGEITATSYPLNLNGPFFTSYPTTLAPGNPTPWDLLGRDGANTGNEYKRLIHASQDKVWIGDTQYNASFSVDNPDLTSTYAAAVFKHKDGTGNHANILEIKDATGIADYIKVSYTGQITAQNITMENLFNETLLQLNDIAVGAAMGFGTSYTDPGVPGDGFKFYANPLGGAPTWVNASSEYLQFDLTGAGTDTANATSLAMPSYGAAAARLNLVGEYYSQPVIGKRLGTSLTGTTTAGAVTTLGVVTTGGASITSGTTIVHGIIAPDSTYSTTGRSGSRFVARNTSSNTVRFVHNSASAVAGEAMRFVDSKDLLLPQYSTAEFIYQSGGSYWTLLGTSSPISSTRSIGTFTGTSITPTSYPMQTWTYQGSSAQTFSTTGFGSLSNLQPGTQITLIGNSDTNTLTINNSDATDGILLPGTSILERGSSLVVEYSSYPARMIKVGGSQ